MTRTSKKAPSTSQGDASTTSNEMYPIPELNPNIPAFIAKLWHMVDDLSTNELIFWGKGGTSFIINDHGKFATELLPSYYKHNNMASFIRQLNMYGFHKVHNMESSMKYERVDLEFFHPAFIRGQPCLLDQIKRKITHTSRELTTDLKGDPNILNKLLQEVNQLRSKQEVFESKITAMKNENDALWREQSILRQKHLKQQKIVNKLIQFLVTLVQQTRSTINVKRRVPLMIKDNRERCQLPTITQEPHNPTGPIICEIDPTEIMYGNNEEMDIPILIQSEPIIAVPLQEISPAIVKGTKNTDQTEKPPQGQSKRPKLMAKRKSKLVSNARKRQFSCVMEGPSEEGPAAGTSLLKRSLKTQQTEVETPSLSVDETAQPGEDVTEEITLPIEQLTSPSEDTIVFSRPSQPIEFTLEEVEDMAHLSESSTVPTVSFEPSPPPQPEENAEKPDDSQALVPSGEFNKEDLDNHLDMIQSDLDILKDILKGEGLSLDANTLLELFSVDDPLSLNLPPDGFKKEESDQNQQLISYSSPTLVDMAELGGELESIDPLSCGPDDLPELNTPQVSFFPFDYSTDPAQKK